MEGIIILTAVVLLFLISQYLKKVIGPKFKPSTKLFLSLTWFLCLMAFIIITDIRKNNFTKPQLFVMIVFSVGYLFYFYWKYKKLNSSTKGNSTIQQLIN